MKIWDTSTFWGRVQEKMDKKGININTLAEKCGLNADSIYNWRSIDRIPRANGAVEKMATYLGTTPEYLMTGKNDEPKLTYDEQKLLLFFQALSDEKKQLALNLLEAMALK